MLIILVTLCGLRNVFKVNQSFPIVLNKEKTKKKAPLNPALNPPDIAREVSVQFDKNFGGNLSKPEINQG